MHPLVQIQHLTRREFTRNLKGLSDEDARKRIEPMNSISWTVGHVANQQHTFFAAWPQGKDSEPRYREFGYSSPASQPPMDEVMGLWRVSSDEWLDVASEESMQVQFTFSEEGENAGALIVRNIFHTWCHLGEISSIRQLLGHQPPEFVDMYGWSYTGQ